MKKLFFLFLTIMLTQWSFAEDVGQILAGSIQDANKYLNAYLQPFAEGQIYNSGRGWYSTGRAHKLLGVDFSIRMESAVIPSNKQSFTFNNSDYSTLKLQSGSTASLPTFMGGETSQKIQATTTVNGNTATTNFNAPNGIGEDFKKNISFLPISAPLPVAQIGIGLIKHTDIKLRYFPKTNFGGDNNNVGIGIFGIGLQHEFTNYLPFAKKIPFLHLSALAAYSNTKVDYSPDMSTSSPVSSTNDKISYGISSFTIQGIASVKFALLEVYGAIGYTAGKSNIDMKGTYTTAYSNIPPPNNKATVTNPISLSYSVNALSNTWGVRLNLAFLKIYADYTIAKYNGIGIGVAFSFR